MNERTKNEMEKDGIQMQNDDLYSILYLKKEGEGTAFLSQLRFTWHPLSRFTYFTLRLSSNIPILSTLLFLKIERIYFHLA